MCLNITKGHPIDTAYSKHRLQHRNNERNIRSDELTCHYMLVSK